MGEILYQDRVIKQGKEEFRGNTLANLKPTMGADLVINDKKERDGCLQFLFRDAPDEDFEGGLPATLTISAPSGETHRSECQLSFLVSYNS